MFIYGFIKKHKKLNGGFKCFNRDNRHTLHQKNNKDI